ncbi:hypothetical protein MKX03_018111 [Papaver bracteatum]|nr:hypothetical protein MKX03_018111 [Papaver bracteatum]
MSENQDNLIPHTPGMNNYVVLRVANTNSCNLLPNLEDKLRGSGHSYMVVFPYRSVVMFNMLDYEFGTYLKIIKRHASGLQPGTGKDCGDSFQHYIGGLNYILLQQLNMDGICTLGSILGKIVALDYYSRLVDQWVKEYSSINYGLEKRGSLSQDTKYAKILDYLRNEFELTWIFAGLDRKFKMGELNIHFVGIQIVQLCVHYRHYVCVILFVLKAFSPIGGLPFSFLEKYLMSP